MIENSPPHAVERGIATLISDGIELAMSADSDRTEFGHALARASILSSALFIEAFANACVDLLNLGNRFSDEIDRLPTISKLDLFLRIYRKGKALDRSRAEYQGYAEVKALRDAFVHPKRQAIIWESWTEDGSVSSSPKTKHLGLSKIPAYCTGEDAVIVLRAAHTFARYVLKDLAGFGKGRINALFYSESAVPNLKDVIVPSWPIPVRDWLKRHSIGLEYLSLRWHREYIFTDE